ncbi:PepSY domain-containing protein [uncultured Methylophaga sp.]|jgi:uncharacterized membrane protein YkoI|uniref:PepSY domain-containing protein n=1 Tax=uncultured Methylophaga sp. TaxID=285271 RepID=UPI00261A26E4|nr:PepSY domain-containing protein [uncultured Methylophaga sp.]
MKKQAVIPLVTTLLLLALIPTERLFADDDSKRARLLQQQGNILPLEQIIDKAMAVKAGQILETELDEDDGEYRYELEILDKQGQVWELELDAASGELIELENED